MSEPMVNPIQGQGHQEPTLENEVPERPIPPSLHRRLRSIYLHFNKLVIFPSPEYTSFKNPLHEDFLMTVIELIAFAQSQKRKENWSIEFCDPSPLRGSTAELLEMLDQLTYDKFVRYMLPPDYSNILRNDTEIDDDHVPDGDADDDVPAGVGDDGPNSFQERVETHTQQSRLNNFLELHLGLEVTKLFLTRISTTGLPEPIFLNPNQVKIKDDIIESLTCPVCYAVCFPPFSHCENLHFLCSNCTEILIRRPLYRSITYNFSHRPNCPTCKSEVVGLKTYWMEGVYEELQFRCGFPGCHFIANGTEIKGHMDCSCRWRTWKCHFCPTILSSGEFNFHMSRAHDLVSNLQDIVQIRITFHGEGRVYGNGTFQFPIKRNAGKLTTYKLYYLKSTFKTERLILYQFESPFEDDHGENTRLMWIPCLLGSEDDAKKYKVKFSIEFKYQSKSTKFQKYTACLKTKDPITVHVASIQKDIRELLIEYGTMYNSNQVPNDIFKIRRWIPNSTDFGNLNVEIIKSSPSLWE